MRYYVSLFLFILLLMLVARTQIGHRIIVYMLWLAVLLLLVTNYKSFEVLFQPLQAGGS